MAVQLKISSKQNGDCKELIITETTGAYDATNNTGGWGAPNETIASITAATFTFTKPDDTTAQIVVFPTLPASTNTSFTITGEDLGYGEDSEIVDGVYQLDYQCTYSGGTVEETFYIVVDCQIKCCIMEHLMTIDPTEIQTDCNCKNESSPIKKFLDMDFLHTVLCAQRSCGKVEEAKETLALLQSICNSTACDGC